MENWKRNNHHLRKWHNRAITSVLFATDSSLLSRGSAALMFRKEMNLLVFSLAAHNLAQSKLDGSQHCVLEMLIIPVITGLNPLITEKSEGLVYPDVQSIKAEQ